MQSRSHWDITLSKCQYRLSICRKDKKREINKILKRTKFSSERNSMSLSDRRSLVPCAMNNAMETRIQLRSSEPNQQTRGSWNLTMQNRCPNFNQEELAVVSQGENGRLIQPNRLTSHRLGQLRNVLTLLCD